MIEINKILSLNLYESLINSKKEINSINLILKLYLQLFVVPFLQNNFTSKPLKASKYFLNHNYSIWLILYFYKPFHC